MFKKPQLPEVERVKLKPIFSIRPAYYILSIFFILLLLIFFILCLFPSFVSDKTYIKFDTPLSSCGIYEDNKYLGNANNGFFSTTSGEHTYIFKYNGIVIGEEKTNISRHYFFTLFKHYNTTITPALTYTEEAKQSAIDSFLSDLSIYSAILEYTQASPYPSIFTDFANDALVMDIQDLDSLFLYGALHITTEEMYDDYIEGKRILSSVLKENSESAKIDNLLSSIFSSSAEISLIKDDKTTPIDTPRKNGRWYTYNSGTITIGETTTLSYPECNAAPQTINYSSFSIMDNLITEYEYSLFVKENPYWAKENIETLIKDGMVDSSYLANINLSSMSMRPIRYISYYAASAYASWLSEKDGENYSLPSEVEWTVAALSAKDKKYVTSLVFIEKDTTTPTSLMGGLWDMTETEYIPLMRLCDYDKIKEFEIKYDSSDIILKGGSFISSSVSISDVAVSTKYNCSEFNGFRLVKR